ncbi:MAG: dihydrolipoamide dehydrogenase [Cytophagaceae bacterium]|nr:dihydrolipoamide dehydrogenase [Cytophagaceae bacterium]|tara:strand:- start:2515 stop:3060 length:546 start_codon:yes stop_codon:yes gene_type:complete
MKRIFGLLAILTIVLTSCEGDPGPQGPPGQDGVNIVGTTFEINSTFEYNNDSNLWSTGFITFSDFTDVEVLESDAVLIYRLDGEGTLNDGSSVDEWSMLPQNFFTNEGTLQYVFNHTFVDAEIFIDGNYDTSNISTGFTDDQVFRIVIVPSDFASQFTGDINNLSEVMNALGQSESDVIRM